MDPVSLVIANRLASNSLLEALVYSAAASSDAVAGLRAARPAFEQAFEHQTGHQKPAMARKLHDILAGVTARRAKHS